MCVREREREFSFTLKKMKEREREIEIDDQNVLTLNSWSLGKGSVLLDLTTCNVRVRSVEYNKYS